MTISQAECVGIVSGWNDGADFGNPPTAGEMAMTTAVAGSMVRLDLERWWRPPSGLNDLRVQATRPLLIGPPAPPDALSAKHPLPAALAV